jgi:hypothetical protein
MCMYMYMDIDMVMRSRNFGVRVMYGRIYLDCGCLVGIDERNGVYACMYVCMHVIMLTYIHSTC